MIEIDGSIGGGSVLRIALGMSVLTKKPFYMRNIRINRPKRGVKAQHLISIEALRKLSDSKFEGAFLGSSEIKFYPGEFKGGRLVLDVKTAGSITLVLQALLLPMVFLKPTSVKIIGGTDVPYSPTSDYFKNVLSFYLRKYADVDIKILRRGYYPKGGGIISVRTKPYRIERYAPLILNKREDSFQIVGISTASKDLMHARVAERQAESANEFLKRELKTKADVGVIYSDSASIGSSICLWAVFNNLQGESVYVLGSDKLGRKGIRSEIVGLEAAKNLVSEIREGVVDKLLADQLVPLLAFVGGRIKTSEITDHIRSAVYTVNKFLDGNKVVIYEGEKIIERKV